jgi:hypothetical protein
LVGEKVGSVQLNEKPHHAAQIKSNVLYITSKGIKLNKRIDSFIGEK